MPIRRNIKVKIPSRGRLARARKPTAPKAVPHIVEVLIQEVAGPAYPISPPPELLDAMVAEIPPDAVGSRVVVVVWTGLKWCSYEDWCIKQFHRHPEEPTVVEEVVKDTPTPIETPVRGSQEHQQEAITQEPSSTFNRTTHEYKPDGLVISGITKRANRMPWSGGLN